MNEIEDNFIKTVTEIIETDFSFDLANYSPQLKSILDEWKGSHPEENLPLPVLWELVALDAMPDLRKERNLGDPYFRPKIEWVKQNTNPPSMLIYPDVQGTLSDDNAIAYFLQRFQETKNIIRKARYADLIWEGFKVRNDRSAYRFAIEAANAYLSQFPLFFQKKSGYIYLVNNIRRVAEISLMLNNPELASGAVGRIFDSFPYLITVNGYRYFCELIEIFDSIGAKFPNMVSSQLWQQIRDISFQFITTLEQQNPLNDLLLQMMVEVVILSSTRLGDEKTAWEYHLRIPEIHENIAKAREEGKGITNGSLIALNFIEDALHEYQKLYSIAPNDEEKARISSKVEELKIKVRNLIRTAEEELHPISTSFKIPQDKLEIFIKPLLEATQDQVLVLLCNYPDLTPNIPKLQDRARQMTKEAPLFSLLRKIHLRDGRIVDKTPPFSDEDALTTQLNFWFQIHIKLLDFVFYRLRQVDKLSFGSIMTYLKSWEFLDERDLPFLEKALSHYFSEDYVSALHILVPRIEHMLKSAFEQCGMPSVAIPNERQVREQTFGDFLRKEEVKKALGESIWHYIYFALIDESGLNLRNDIAHGWMKIDGCNRFTFQISIYCVLLLTNLRRVPNDVSGT